METRYEKNMGMIDDTGMVLLKAARIAVVGCGGLGGYVIEMLGRIGIGTITAVDGDSFDETNLNRQLLSDSSTLGKSKAEAAAARMLLVNPFVRIIQVRETITDGNAARILGNHEVIIDAVDSVTSRMVLERAAEILGIPLVHGAIGGWYGQVTTIFPGDKTLVKIYPADDIEGIESKLGNPSFTPALIASIQTSEAVKIVLGKEDLLRNKILRTDLLTNEFTIIEF